MHMVNPTWTIGMHTTRFLRFWKVVTILRQAGIHCIQTTPENTLMMHKGKEKEEEEQGKRFTQERRRSERLKGRVPERLQRRGRKRSWGLGMQEGIRQIVSVGIRPLLFLLQLPDDEKTNREEEKWGEADSTETGVADRNLENEFFAFPPLIFLFSPFHMPPAPATFFIFSSVLFRYFRFRWFIYYPSGRLAFRFLTF